MYSLAVTCNINKTGAANSPWETLHKPGEEAAVREAGDVMFLPAGAEQVIHH